MNNVTNINDHKEPSLDDPEVKVDMGQAGYAVRAIGQDIDALERMFADIPKLVAIDYSALVENHNRLAEIIVRINKFIKGE